MSAQQEEWVILGVTKDGRIFDVPNWTDHLCGLLAKQTSDNRLGYSRYLQPVMIDGLPAVVMQLSLERDEKHVFDAIKRFVEENHLKTRSGRERREGESSGLHPVLNNERRDAGRNGSV